MKIRSYQSLILSSISISRITPRAQLTMIASFKQAWLLFSTLQVGVFIYSSLSKYPRFYLPSLEFWPLLIIQSFYRVRLMDACILPNKCVSSTGQSFSRVEGSRYTIGHDSTRFNPSYSLLLISIKSTWCHNTLRQQRYMILDLRPETSPQVCTSFRSSSCLYISSCFRILRSLWELT